MGSRGVSIGVGIVGERYAGRVTNG
jgi:hypothetical protein